ncbi:MAG: DUF3243 family protein [Thermoanaerobacterales bacterium]|nr:DUF3243 family protein [Bacillota bacterium]MDI6907061.1 DUF3243 family protein [Thermoanaerobacterales bacterium]
MDPKLASFPKEIAEKIQEGRGAGLSNEQIAEGIVHLGNVVAKFVKPDSPEEALMEKMWQVSTDEEKRTMANIVLRMADRL